MVGIVVVSHSRALASAAVALAEEMVPEDARPAIGIAAGLSETVFGTDAADIAETVQSVDSPDGVLILVDLGSALLSAEMALEFIGPDVADHVKISAAPLVEGLLAAVVSATAGSPLTEVAREAELGLLAKREHLGYEDAEPDVPMSTDELPDFTSGGVLHYTTTILNSHGLHARPAAALVAGLRGIDATVTVSNASTGKGPVPATSLTLIQTLGLRHGDELEVTIVGREAEDALDAIIHLAEAQFGEAPLGPNADAPTPTPPKPKPADPTRTGRQIVIGPAHHVSITPDISEYVPGSPEVELARLNAAIGQAGEILDELERAGGLGIYQVQSIMLADDITQAKLREAIASGVSAVDAVQERFTALAADLDAIPDAYLRARAEDHRGLRRVLLRILTGKETSTAFAAGIMIINELDPLTSGSLDPRLCQGVITTSGGSTGHGVILAQARGFAVLTGRPEAVDISEDTNIAFDPVTGELLIDPSPAQLDVLAAKQKERDADAVQAAQQAHDPALTLSGRQITVEANIASLEDAVLAMEKGAEGSGLVRTEVLFADWKTAPTAEEQAETYVAIGKALGGALITIRTWDPGGDKPLPFLPQDPEANPMLGERGIRAMRRNSEIFDEQLRAILLASRETPVRVMFPMVTGTLSVEWGRQRIAAQRRLVGGSIDQGIMIETPAAAIRAEDFLGMADFISFGTNDLTQYTMAMDRGNARVSSIGEGPLPAVWDLMTHAAQVFKGKPVAVCGDMASNPELVSRLVGIGVTELSVRPPLIGVVKQAVRRV
ncbi:MAG: HPr family phosphocarrier protein [Propionibacteriaceae bacterium]|nr:HPr family phosphocarrier protein [Propionibacteriaceae bacterium]